MGFLCYIYFIILTILGFRLLYKQQGTVRVPYTKDQTMSCSGPELLMIFLFTTGTIGILPVSAVRLAVQEVTLILALCKLRGRIIFSGPMMLFVIFLLWEFIGLTYTPSVMYGVRMILKYLYPFLLVLFASAVVRDAEVFLKSAVNARKVAVISAIAYSIPVLNYTVFLGVFWNSAALATHYISLCMFSLGMVYISNAKKQNLLWAIALAAPAFIWVYRTDIMGLSLALSVFFFVKYKLKSIPYIVTILTLSVLSIFFIPSIKSKMYFNPDEVTFEDFIYNKVDEDNINTSGRKAVWEDVKEWFYEPNKLVGSGTGRVQTYFYEEADGWRNGGQLHSDFLLMRCDNGDIGLGLFLLAYFAVLIHCFMIYQRTGSQAVRLCTLVAGSSLIGILVTMYSDNTVSYSMCTLGYPWGFYGMALGLDRANREK